MAAKQDVDGEVDEEGKWEIHRRKKSKKRMIELIICKIACL